MTCLRGDSIVQKITSGETFTIYDEYDRYKFKTFEAGTYTAHALQQKVVANGERCCEEHTLGEKKTYYNSTLSRFSPSERRLINPHYYKVDISDDLYDMKMNIINKLTKEINEFHI